VAPRRLRRPHDGAGLLGRQGALSVPGPGAAPPVMDFELTAEQELARRTAREFAEGEIGPVIARFDEAEEVPAELVGKLGALGFLGALFPPEYGGAGLDYVAYALVVEELSRIDGSIGITMWAHNSLCTNHIYSFGTEAQRQRYVPPLARGEI